MNPLAQWTWLGACVSLGVGLVAGVIFALFTRRSREAFPEAAADLEEQLTHCVAQLRDLEEQRTRLTEVGYQEQKAEFEARAAQLLRSRQELERSPTKRRVVPAPSQPASPVVSFLEARPQLRGAIWGGGTVGVVALLYGLVVSQQHERPADAPRPPMAGGGAGGAENIAEQGEVKELLGKVEKNPNDVDSMLRLAHILMRAQMLEQAAAVNERALRLDPNSLEGRTHAVVLKASRGDATEAFKELDALVNGDARGFAEAWFFRGMLSMQRGDQATMRESFTHFLQVAPEGPQKDRVRVMMGQSSTAK